METRFRQKQVAEGVRFIQVHKLILLTVFFPTMLLREEWGIQVRTGEREERWQWNPDTMMAETGRLGQLR